MHKTSAPVLWLLTACLLLLTPVLTVAADCGSITFTWGGVPDTEAIEDCDNPFGVPNPNPDLAVHFAGQAIEAGSSYTFFNQTGAFSIDNPDDPFFETLTLYRKTAAGYDGFFIDGTHTFTATGTYVLVIEEQGEPILSWQQQLRSWLLPTAHAAVGDRTIIEFTVADPNAEPAGASNVLFLPGIQASRLYTTAGSQLQQRWTPLLSGDFEALVMEENGQSRNEVFTNDVVDDVLPLGTVYGELLNYLDLLKDEDTIADYSAFAYDWRYSVVDLVNNGTEYFDGTKYLDEQLEMLASSSQTGKVTIVAHSNGGLLAKALLQKLETENRLNLVDDFIMVGTPQLGTPKAITSLLHGLGQGISYQGWLTIVSEETARDVAITTPGAYGLLPGAAYVERTSEPLIEFAAGTATQPFLDTYSQNISSASELDDFLLDVANTRDAAERAAHSAELNQALLTQARAEQTQLIDWTPPPSVDTYSLIGTGRNTIRGIRYESFTERDCNLFGSCTEQDIYKPVPLFSANGDATVMASSAVGDESIKNFYVDLLEIQANTEDKYQHYNFTEAHTVQRLIGNLIQSSSTSLEFVSTSTPVVGQPEQVLLGAHSPVYFYVSDASGRRTGQLDKTTILEEIPRTEFLRLGESRYLIIPQDADITLHLVGYEQGVATLSVSDLAAEDQPMLHKVSIKEITASTTVVADYTSAELQNLEVDQDGDGTRDYQLTPTGKRIDDQPTDITYSILFAYMQDNLDRYIVRAIDGLPRLAEHFSQKQNHPYFQFIEYRLLNKFSHLLTRLHEYSFISEQHRNVLLNYVTELQAKINI